MNYFSKVHLSHLFQKLWAWRNSLLAQYLSSSFELLFDRYYKIPNLTKSVEVVLIRYNNNTGSSSISTKDESRHGSSINDKSGESLVDTALSILKMLLLSFIIFFFYLLGKENSLIVQLAEIHSIFELFYFLFLTFIFIFNL